MLRVEADFDREKEEEEESSFNLFILLFFSKKNKTKTPLKPLICHHPYQGLGEYRYKDKAASQVLLL
jgi:hypothetical protein